MDKLEKQWLVFEAFGVNFPWKDITNLPEEELDFLNNKAEEAKKRHEAQVEAQKQQQQAQQAQMAAMQAAQQQGGARPQGGNIITPDQAYSFDQP
jgi:hypothetical protein